MADSCTARMKQHESLRPQGTGGSLARVSDPEPLQNQVPKKGNPPYRRFGNDAPTITTLMLLRSSVSQKWSFPPLPGGRVLSIASPVNLYLYIVLAAGMVYFLPLSYMGRQTDRQADRQAGRQTSQAAFF